MTNPAELKALTLARIRAHEVFDALWNNSNAPLRRGQAYARLARKLGLKEVHIAESDVERCEQIIVASRELLAEATRATKEGE